ncbi:kinase-like domain-containing protein [Rhizophagus irregularis DAOM 181602=DAOM 197198]|nr:kinase-like domain-containing protein [Rhizophagus irregularis DAOM 181602=DAOM 197198]
MDEIKLSDDIFEQIKDFDYEYLTEEQESLIDKLITDEELNERYRENGLCKLSQLKAEWDNQIIEWIEYDKFEDVEYLAKGGFGTTFKAVWKDGPWEFYYNYEQLERKGETKVALKCLHNSQDITADFLKEVESNILVYSYFTVRCFEPKNADSNDDLIGIEYSESIKVDFTKLNINSEDSYIIPYYNILLSRLEDFWDSPEAASNVISKLLEYYDKADTSIYTISLVLDPCLKFNT